MFELVRYGDLGWIGQLRHYLHGMLTLTLLYMQAMRDILHNIIIPYLQIRHKYIAFRLFDPSEYYH